MGEKTEGKTAYGAKKRTQSGGAEGHRLCDHADGPLCRGGPLQPVAPGGGAAGVPDLLFPDFRGHGPYPQ